MSQHKPPLAGGAPGAPAKSTVRQKAEAQWQSIQQKSLKPIDNASPRDIDILVHELQVHQIELEMQNEELLHAQEALEASRSRYVDLYNLAPVGYCSVNEAGLIVQANLTLATLLGVARGALGRQPPFTNYVRRSDQDNWYKLRQLVRESGARQVGELRLRLNRGPASSSDDGAYLWVQLAITVGQDELGAPMLHVSVSDIHERKQAEVQLLLSASVFGHTREGIMITDADAVIIDVNEAFTRITGYSRAEIIGQDSRILRSDRQDTAFYESIWNDLAGQGHWSGEMWSRHKSGKLLRPTFHSQRGARWPGKSAALRGGLFRHQRRQGTSRRA